MEHKTMSSKVGRITALPLWAQRHIELLTAKVASLLQQIEQAKVKKPTKFRNHFDPVTNRTGSSENNNWIDAPCGVEVFTKDPNGPKGQGCFLVQVEKDPYGGASEVVSIMEAGGQAIVIEPSVSNVIKISLRKR